MPHTSFYEPVYYRIEFSEPDFHLPSSSNEKKGYWVGFAANQGDSLTWRTLTEDTHMIILCSGIQSVLSITTNQCLASPSGEGTTLPFPIPYPQQSQLSLPLDPLDEFTPNSERFVNSQSGEDEDNPIPMANIDIPNVLGRSFLLPPEDNGEHHMSKIINIDDHGQPLEDLKIKLQVNKDQAEEIMSYNQLMDYILRCTNDEEDQDSLFKFRDIVAHQSPLEPTNPNHKRSKYNVMVEWESGEVTLESLPLISKDNPVTCTLYAKKHDLLDTTRSKRLIRAVKQSRIHQVRASARYQHSFQISTDYNHAIRPDKKNSNTHWQDTMDLDDSNPTFEHFVNSQSGEDEDNPIPMTNIDIPNLLGRSFLLPPEDNGERHMAKIVDIDDHGQPFDDIKFKLKIHKDQAEEIMSYNQLMDYIQKGTDAEEDPDSLFKFRDIVAHQGPLESTDPNHKGSKYNVMVEWESGEITYEPLALISKDDPITCAVYAKKHDLLDTTGWKHLKRYAKTSKRLIRAVKQSRIRQVRASARYQHGFQVPRDYNDAMRLDKENGNTHWQDAMDLELTQIHEYKVFRDTGKAKFHNGKVVTPDGFQKIRVHFVYAVKHDGRFKARLVADGHLTKEPVESIYSGVVSLRSLRMVVFLSQLNNLEIWGADVGNAYLEAYTDEKLCIMAGPEFKELQGHLLIMVKALYGTRSGGARWHDRLFDILQELKFKPSKADPDVWMRPEPGGTCYEYIAVYVDDLAIAAKDPQAFCNELKKKYNLKLKGVGPLEYHLGCTYKKDPDGTLAADPRRYVNKILESYERMFMEKPRKSRPPLEGGDHPELDTSELCDEHQTKQFQTLIGQLQWLISLGRFDIAVHVMSLSRFRSQSRKGHLDRAKRIVGYLLFLPDGAIRFRTGEPDFSSLRDQEYDWTRTVYSGACEQIPHDIPKPLGKHVQTTHYVDAHLHHDLATGKAVTAVLHFLNQTPIDAYTKRQSTVETATYGSEFVAARTAVD